MHHIHQTRAFVLASRNIGPASKLLSLFTREFGMIFASAQALRSLGSKLRFHLQDYAEGHVSLVRGKNGWRITGAESERQWCVIFKDQPERLQLTARTFLLLRQFLAGEERNENIYALLEAAFAFFRSASFTSQQLKSFEILLVLRILSNLGYIGESENLGQFCKPREPLWNEELLSQMEMCQREALLHVNRALKESHL